MGSKREQNNKQNQERISFLTEETEEIKEIVERKPEPMKKGTAPNNRCGMAWKEVKHTAGHVFGMLSKWFGKVCKDTRSLGLLAVGVIGLGLLITVIVLAVRLGGVSRELKSVQALSLGLQEELTAAKEELSENKKQLSEKNTKEQEIALTSAVIPSPSVTPMPTATPAAKKYIVCLDPGHGDWDGGAVYKDESGRELRAEKDDNLRMSKWIKEALEAYDVEVVLTRETDIYLELKERTAIANNANADALISFHRNSFNGDETVCGVEVWIHSSQPQGAKTLANGILDAVMEVGGLADRGVKFGSMSSNREDFEINRSAKMTSMIVELGFISSAADNAVYDDNGKAYAENIAKAVYEWLETQNSVE